jgi:hypothetical protein
VTRGFRLGTLYGLKQALAGYGAAGNRLHRPPRRSIVRKASIKHINRPVLGVPLRRDLPHGRIRLAPTVGSLIAQDRWAAVSIIAFVWIDKLYGMIPSVGKDVKKNIIQGVAKITVK